MTDRDLVEARLRSLQDGVARMDAEQAKTARRLRGTLLVTALSGVLLALTCGSWRENSRDVRFTLWSMVDSIGFEALPVLVLVVVTAFGSILLAASPARATGLRRVVGASAWRRGADPVPELRLGGHGGSALGFGGEHVALDAGQVEGDRELAPDADDGLQAMTGWCQRYHRSGSQRDRHARGASLAFSPSPRNRVAPHVDTG
ncbi:hypothetical protein V5P93_003867 [Actinokineospora auranticolor]|uniref:Uncharacterized protein n=1 Tax=Actinokineospora auranticolor TaxID=155976 RepID=A0A2S6GLV7_9PSEU|nr:hypothetical protein [Actinokineospora auranticolor]PPK66153.1 hypothetical protein CLV40_111117 [Actinokineospora auranticolor]